MFVSVWGVYFLFIVGNLSFHKTTPILLDVSIVLSCRIMYLLGNLKRS